MRTIALLLAAVVTLSLGASDPACAHDAQSSEMPSKCPFVSATTGFECFGFVMMDGFSIAGDKYKCSRGHQWIVSRR